MSLKRWLRCAVAMVLIIASLLFSACSTPTVAMEVGGKVYEMGDYLAYAYGTAYADYNSYFYLSYYGKEALSMDFVYGEGDEEEDVTMEEYLILTTRDMMVRQKALEDMMAEYKLEWDKDELKTVEKELDKLTTDQFLPIGFTNERYIKMYKAMQLNESTVFDGLYNKGGLREVAEEDMRKYFEDNYLSYFIFEVSLVDKDNKDLSKDIIADYQEHFDGYLKTFNGTKKTIEDFQKVYREFLADTAEDEKKDEDSASADTKATTDTGDAKDEDKEEEKSLERQDIVKEADGVDEDLVKAVSNIPEGSAEVVTYKQGGTKKTMALIFRLDPEAQRDKDEDFFEDSRDQTLQYMKYDEFEEELNDKMDDLLETATINKRALNAVDFLELLGVQ